MKRFVKFLGIALGVVVLLVVALAIALPFLIDPNEYKPQIIQTVKKQTGRDLSLEGDIGLSIFPWIGLELGKTQLSNAPGFGAKPFVHVDQVGIKVELLPLLRKQVLVDKVVLDGLQLNLARDRKGRTNWDDLVEAFSSKDKAAPVEKEKPGTAIGVGVAGFDVKRGDIHWVDAMSGSDYHVRELTLRTGNIAIGKPVDLHLSFDMESGKPAVKTRVALNGDVMFDVDSQRLQSKNLTLEAAGLKLTASLDGKRLMQQPSFSGKAQLADFNLRKFLADLNIPMYETADSKALSKASLQTTFAATTSEVSLTNLRLGVDDSAITGSASARFASLPAVRFDLTLNQIDVDRYLPPPTEDGSAGAGKGTKPTPVKIPVKLLRQLDARGKFAIKKMKAMGIRSSDIAIPVAAKGGLINIGPNAAKLYDGRYSGYMSMDVRKGAPRYSINEKLTGVQIGPFLKDAGVFDKFDGQGNVSAKITARGLDVDDIVNTMNGSAAASLKNGSLSGIDIYETINNKCRALQQPGAAPAPATSKNQSTPFADFNTTASIVNGVVSNKDLRVHGKLLRINGKGKVDLPKRYVDYIAQINLLGETSCWTTEFAVLVKGRFKEISLGKIIGDTLAYEWQKQIERKAKKALEDELKKRLGVPQTQPAPAAPEKKAAPSPEEELKKKLEEEMRKRLGL